MTGVKIFGKLIFFSCSPIFLWFPSYITSYTIFTVECGWCQIFQFKLLRHFFCCSNGFKTNFQSSVILFVQRFYFLLFFLRFWYFFSFFPFLSGIIFFPSSLMNIIPEVELLHSISSLHIFKFQFILNFLFCVQILLRDFFEEGKNKTHKYWRVNEGDILK